MNTRSHSLLILVGLLLTGCFGQISSDVPSVIRSVTLAGVSVDVVLADTAEKQIRGLGGVTELGWTQGMLFPFEQKAARIFWMKDMLIPIDIIWLSDTMVVGIEKSVPPPQPGQSDGDLPTYRSPDSVNYVLEVPAGFAEKNGLKVGDVVSYN